MAASVSKERPGAGQAALSIDVADWFHAENLKPVITREAWGGCELRVERNTSRMLEILVCMILRSCRPYSFYIHPWEIDQEQPRVRGLDARSHFHHRVNLHRCEKRVAARVGALEWSPICDLIDRWKAARGGAQPRYAPS
jgi:hypothetical protein